MAGAENGSWTHDFGVEERLASLESSQHQLIDIIILGKLKTKKSRYHKYINKGIYING